MSWLKIKPESWFFVRNGRRIFDGVSTAFCSDSERKQDIHKYRDLKDFDILLRSQKDKTILDWYCAHVPKTSATEPVFDFLSQHPIQSARRDQYLSHSCIMRSIHEKIIGNRFDTQKDHSWSLDIMYCHWRDFALFKIAIGILCWHMGLGLLPIACIISAVAGAFFLLKWNVFFENIYRKELFLNSSGRPDFLCIEKALVEASEENEHHEIILSFCEKFHTLNREEQELLNLFVLLSPPEFYDLTLDKKKDFIEKVILFTRENKDTVDFALSLTLSSSPKSATLGFLRCAMNGLNTMAPYKESCSSIEPLKIKIEDMLDIENKSFDFGKIYPTLQQYAVRFFTGKNPFLVDQSLNGKLLESINKFTQNWKKKHISYPELNIEYYIDRYKFFKGMSKSDQDYLTCKFSMLIHKIITSDTCFYFNINIFREHKYKQSFILLLNDFLINHIEVIKRKETNIENQRMLSLIGQHIASIINFLRTENNELVPYPYQFDFQRGVI
jgi:hypothetical protein